MDIMEIILEIKRVSAELMEALEKAHKMTAPARRARMLTIDLAKLYKEFRKVSCELGLK